LIVKLEPLFDIGRDLVFVGRCDWRSEEVEEGFRGDGLLDDSGLLGVCSNVSMYRVKLVSKTTYSCFSVSCFQLGQ
jgi:hypothetical protein